MAIVIDASVSLAWHFDDEVSEYADRILEELRAGAGLVPAIWPLEVANALLIAERRGRLSPARTARAVDLFKELPLQVQEIGAQDALGPILDLARAEDLSVYDASYLELAMREGLPLATEDAALKSAAVRVGVTLAE